MRGWSLHASARSGPGRLVEEVLTDIVTDPSIERRVRVQAVHNLAHLWANRLTWREIVALSAPTADGVYATLKVHDAPAASDVPQVLPLTSNSAALLLARVTEFAVAPPVLVTVSLPAPPQTTPVIDFVLVRTFTAPPASDELFSSRLSTTRLAERIPNTRGYAMGGMVSPIRSTARRTC